MKHLLLTTLTLAATAFGAADPQLLSLSIPDAKILAGAQLDQTRASPFGQFVLSQVASDAQFDQIKTMTGFDPRTDLSEIVASATGPGTALASGRGKFDLTRIATLAAVVNAAVESYRGVSLYSPPQTQKTATGIAPQVVGFLDGSTVLLGTTAQVKAAIDRWTSSIKTTGPLIDRAVQISATTQAWGVGAGLASLAPAPPTNAPPQAVMAQNVLSAIDQLSGGVTFGDSIAVQGQALTHSAQDAQSLADVLKLVAMMAAQQQPLAQGAQFAVQGSAVTFSFSVPESQVETLLKPAAKAAAPRAAIRRGI